MRDNVWTKYSCSQLTADLGLATRSYATADRRHSLETTERNSIKINVI